MPEASPLPAFLLAGEAQQVDPPGVQQHPPASAQEPHSPVPSTPAPALVHVQPAPVETPTPRAPTAQDGPSASAPPM